MLSFVLSHHAPFEAWLEPARPLLYDLEATRELIWLPQRLPHALLEMRQELRTRREQRHRVLLVLSEADTHELLAQLPPLPASLESFIICAFGGASDSHYGFAKVAATFQRADKRLHLIRTPGLMQGASETRLKTAYLLKALCQDDINLEDGEYYLEPAAIELDSSSLSGWNSYKGVLGKAKKDLEAIELKTSVRFFDDAIKELIKCPDVAVPATVNELLLDRQGTVSLSTHWLAGEGSSWSRWQQEVESRSRSLRTDIDERAKGCMRQSLERLAKAERQTDPVDQSLSAIEQRLVSEQQRFEALQRLVYQPAEAIELSPPEWGAVGQRYQAELARRPHIQQVVGTLILAVLALLPSVLLLHNRWSMILSATLLLLLTLNLLDRSRRQIQTPISSAANQAASLAAAYLNRLSAYSSQVFARVREQLELWVLEQNLRSLREAKAQLEQVKHQRHYHVAQLSRHLQQAELVIEDLALAAPIQALALEQDEAVNLTEDCQHNQVYAVLPHINQQVLADRQTERPVLEINSRRLALTAKAFAGLRRIRLESTAPSEGNA